MVGGPWVARVQISQLGAGRTEDRERVTGAPIGGSGAAREPAVSYGASAELRPT